jgi:hypothetical protein
MFMNVFRIGGFHHATIGKNTRSRPTPETIRSFTGFTVQALFLEPVYYTPITQKQVIERRE